MRFRVASDGALLVRGLGARLSQKVRFELGVEGKEVRVP